MYKCLWEWFLFFLPSLCAHAHYFLESQKWQTRANVLVWLKGNTCCTGHSHHVNFMNKLSHVPCRWSYLLSMFFTSCGSIPTHDSSSQLEKNYTSKSGSVSLPSPINICFRETGAVNEQDLHKDKGRQDTRLHLKKKKKVQAVMLMIKLKKNVSLDLGPRNLYCSQPSSKKSFPTFMSFGCSSSLMNTGPKYKLHLVLI